MTGAPERRELNRVESALRETEARYRSLFEGMPVGLYRSTPGGRILDANPALARILGYPSVEALMATPASRLYPDPSHRETWRARLEEAGELTTELEHRRADGTPIWVLDTARAVRGPDGRIVHYEGMQQDLTNRKQAESALRESEARYRGLYEGVPAGIYRATPDGRILDVNPEMARMLGFPDRASLLAVSAKALWAYPEERAVWAEQLERDGIIEGYEIALRKRDGTTLWALDTSHVVRGEDGTIVAYEGIREDVTAAKAAREALAATSEKLLALFDASPVAIVSLDLERRMTGWNRAAEELFGWKAEEVLGRPYPLVPADGLDAFTESWNAIVAGETLRGDELSRVRKDGTTVTVLLSAAPLRDASGEVSGVIGVMLDVTEQRRREEQLRFQATVLDQVRSAVMTTDLHGNVTYLNRHAEQLYGWSAGEAMGRSMVSLTVPEESHGATDRFMELLKRGYLEGELTLRRRDGTTFPAYVHDQVITDDAGEPVGVVGISIDISERLEAQQATQDSLEALKHADEQRRRLLASLVKAQEDERRRIADDIHDDTIQVMAAAGLRLGILARTLGDEHGGDLLAVEQTVESAITRLRNLMFALRPPSLDSEGLGAAIRTFVDNLDGGLTPRISVESRLVSEPPLDTRAILFRIFQEAITNVRKHASASGVHVLLEEAEAGYRLVVRDDGRGFDPGADDDIVPGHVGLLSMRERAELAGGRLRIEAAPGAGTTVDVWVPGTPTRLAGSFA